MLPRIFQPTRQVVECFAPGDIVDQQSASSTPVVRPRDRAEGFLTSLQERRMVKLEVSPRRLPSPPKRCERSNGSKAYRVPDLQFDLFVVNGHHSRTELHSDGQVVDRLKSFVGPALRQSNRTIVGWTRFRAVTCLLSLTCVSDDDVLEEISAGRVRVGRQQVSIARFRRLLRSVHPHIRFVPSHGPIAPRPLSSRASSRFVLSSRARRLRSSSLVPPARFRPSLSSSTSFPRLDPSPHVRVGHGGSA
eukprot:scaffold544_cov320-Pavlova_lutheri.AAC.22